MSRPETPTGCPAPIPSRHIQSQCRSKPGHAFTKFILAALVACALHSSPLPAQLTLLPGTTEPLAFVPPETLPDAPSTTQPSQPAASQDAPTPSRNDQANQQVNQQEKQRVLGVFPQFNVSYVPDAVSLTSKQKFRLAFRSVRDPVAFAGAFIVAGLREANDSDPALGWGPVGYLHRVGVTYLDTVSSTMIGKAILPSILHQDPRYFRLGHGSFTRRLLYSFSGVVICKHDNTGKWEPNYSRVGGIFASGAISNLYYPDRADGGSQTVTNALVVMLTGTVGLSFNEFWPDLSRKFLHKDPTNGIDAEQAAARAAAPSSTSH